MNYNQFHNDLEKYYKNSVGKVEKIHIDQVRKWVSRYLPEGDLDNALDVITANCSYYPSVAQLNDLKSKSLFESIRPQTFNKEFIIRMKELKAMFVEDMAAGTVEEWCFYQKNEALFKKWEEEEDERRILAMSPEERKKEQEAVRRIFAEMLKDPGFIDISKVEAEEAGKEKRRGAKMIPIVDFEKCQAIEGLL